MSVCTDKLITKSSQQIENSFGEIVKEEKKIEEELEKRRRNKDTDEDVQAVIRKILDFSEIRRTGTSQSSSSRARRKILLPL